MNQITYSILKRELESGKYLLYQSNNSLRKLFDIYCDCEIHSLDDIQNKDHMDFHKFIRENCNLFPDLDRDEDEQPTDETKICLFNRARNYVSQFSILNNKYFQIQLDTEKKWVETIKKIVGNSNLRLLEVGSGAFPCSSILLAQDLDHISSMDKFSIDTEILRRLNIDPHNELFNSTTQVKDYDLIVGKKPCSAIKHIVNSKKPYLLELCNCDAPNNDNKKWPLILRMADKNIRFSKSGRFAYNLDSDVIPAPEGNCNIIESEMI